MKKDQVQAPWTAEQIASLNAYQADDTHHPFTGERAADGSETILIATPEGWVERPNGPVVQSWAHRWMADWSWVKPEGSVPAGAKRQINLTGLLVPWGMLDPELVASGSEHEVQYPVLVKLAGSSYLYMPCFTSEELLRKTMQLARIDFSSIIRISNGSHFFENYPRRLGGYEVRLIVDLRFVGDADDCVVHYCEVDG